MGNTDKFDLSKDYQTILILRERTKLRNAITAAAINTA